MNQSGIFPFLAKDCHHDCHPPALAPHFIYPGRATVCDYKFIGVFYVLK